MTIIPITKPGPSRTGTLSNITIEEITSLLGFEPNCEDDPDKVVNSWGFTVDGERCGIWDYRGSRSFSTFGPAGKLSAIFGDRYEGGI